jgi:hypothetical protein
MLGGTTLTAQEAYALVERLELVAEVEPELERLYEKAYRSFVRNQKIKGFFKGLFGGKR